VHNCKSEYYGVDSLSPTGPNLFGRAIAISDYCNNTIFGDLLTPTAMRKNETRAMVLPNGDVFAFLKAAPPGDLTKLGAQGVNNYNKLYAARAIYNPSIRF
jgi:hypothetical protein